MVDRWDRFLTWWSNHRLGSRAWDLILLSIVWVVVGWSVTANGDPEPGVKVPLDYLSEPARAFLWYGAAAVATTVALIRPLTRNARDSIGFAILILPPALRALSYWIAWFEGLIGVGGEISLWPNAVVWSTICIIVYRLAQRPELPRRPDGGEYGHRPHPRRPAPRFHDQIEAPKAEVDPHSPRGDPS